MQSISILARPRKRKNFPKKVRLIRLDLTSQTLLSHQKKRKHDISKFKLQQPDFEDFFSKSI